MSKISIKKPTDSTGVVEYNMHLGNHVRELIKANKALRQTELCEILHITTTAMQGKLNNPIYGNVYDLIKTSQFIGIDLFDFIRKHLAKSGNALFSGADELLASEFSEAKRRISLMKIEIETLEKLAKVREQLK